MINETTRCYLAVVSWAWAPGIQPVNGSEVHSCSSALSFRPKRGHKLNLAEGT